MDKVAKSGLIFLALLITTIIGLFLWIVIAEESPQELPTASEPGILTVTSNGCCFFAKNLTVSLNHSHTLLTTPTVYEQDIYYADLSLTSIEEPSATVTCTFDYYYSEKGSAKIDVIHCSNIAELIKNGLLLTFGDATLTARSGTQEFTYALQGDIWVLEQN